MAQDVKHSFNGRRKQSAGFNSANMKVFMNGGTKRKSKRKVRGK